MFENLLKEIERGEVQWSKLSVNASLEFSGDCQAMYFSRLRVNLVSSTAFAVMHNSQDLRELRLLEQMRGE